MNNGIVISTDGACSGRRAACAAVLTIDGRVVEKKSRTVPHVQGYALAAEIAGVALAAALIERAVATDSPVTVEVDNPLVPRVLRGDYRPPGFRRIPRHVRESAEALCWRKSIRFSVLRRNSTPGLRRAHRLASVRLWGKRRARKSRR